MGRTMRTLPALFTSAYHNGKEIQKDTKMGRKAKLPTDYDWTPEREEMLLNFWEEHAFLYNLELKDYSNLQKKRRTYEKFALEMGTTVEQIQRRMASFCTMRSQIRKKEEECPSGSSPCKLTKRQQFVKARLAFLERHVKTRKSVSTLPEVPMSQVTDDMLFSQDSNQALVDREDMERYMGPSAIDGFVGAGYEFDEESLQQDEQVGRFPIPRELLLELPIAEVTHNTRIIPIQNPRSETPVPKKIGDAFEPRPGTSGMGIETHVNVMDTQESCNTVPEPIDNGLPLNVNVAKPTNTTPDPIEEVPNPKRTPANNSAKNPQPNTVRVPAAPAVPKKGYNTKNRTPNQDAIEAQDKDKDKDNNVARRLEVLGEIAEIVRNSGEKRKMGELDVWGHYIGLKVARVVEGRRRDKVLVSVEQLINDAIYDEEILEE